MYIPILLLEGEIMNLPDEPAPTKQQIPRDTFSQRTLTMAKSAIVSATRASDVAKACDVLTELATDEENCIPNRAKALFILGCAGPKNNRIRECRRAISMFQEAGQTVAGYNEKGKPSSQNLSRQLLYAYGALWGALSEAGEYEEADDICRQFGTQIKALLKVRWFVS